MNQQPCPTEEQLEQLLNGTLPDPPASDVEAHWQACSLCEGTVVELEAANDTLVRQFKQLPLAPHVTDDPAVRRMLDRLHSLDASSLIAGGHGSDSVTGAPAGHAQLTPPLGLFGAYELIEIIGRGGMGTVYRARHRRLDQEVAIKVVPGGQIQNPEIIARFDREMKAVGRLKHPNLVQAQDAGETEGNEFLYLVMELLDGVDVESLHRRIGQLPVAEACEITRQAALALRYVHQQRQVHRDVKPSNLMVTREGTVKLLDLGLALLGDAPEHTLTTAGQIMGTLDFMSPEQAGSSHEVDRRADVYSLGCSLFALLTGAAPFAGSEHSKPAQKILAHATLVPPSVRTKRPDSPAALAELTQRMLEKEPSQRPDLDEIIDRLSSHCQGADLAALVTGSAPTPQQRNPSIEQAKPTRPSSARAATSQRGWKFWISIAALLLIGGIGFGQVVIIIKNKGNKQRRVIAENQSATIDGKTGKVTMNNASGDTPGQQSAISDSLPIMGSRALVAEPRKLPGVESWTIETTAPRGEILSARFSPDGRRVAAWSQDGVLRVWNATTGELVGMFPVPGGYLSQHPTAFDFSPDSNRLVLAAGNMRVWEIDSGRLVWQWNSPESMLPREHFRVAWSPDGHWIATDKRGQTDGESRGGRNIQIWNAETGVREKTLLVAQTEHATESLGIFNWSPDSARLAVASEISNAEVSFELLDLATGKRVQARTIEIAAGWNQFAFMAWSTDSKRIAVTAEGVVIVWDAEAWSEMDRIAFGQNPRTAIRWLDAGQTLALGELHYRYAADQATAQPGSDLLQNPGEQTICDWTPDGSRILWHDKGYASTLAVVDATDASQRLELTRPIRPVNDQGRLFRREWQSNDVIRFDGFAWNIKTGRRLEQVGPLATESVETVVAPSPDGNWLLVGAQPPVLRRRDGSQPDRELVDEEQPIAPWGGIACAAWSSDSRKVCVTGENCVRTWDAETGELLGRIENSSGLASEVAVFAPSGNEIFSGGAHAGFRVRTVSGELSQEFPKPPVQHNAGDHTGAAIWTSDGLRWRVIQSYGRVIEWNAQTGQEVSRSRFRLDNISFQPPWRGMTSPDERTMACAGASCVYLFSTDTLRSVGTIVQLGSNWLFVHPDGQINGEYYPDGDLRYLVQRNGHSSMILPSAFNEEYGQHLSNH